MMRSTDVGQFYELLEQLEETVGGKQKLKDCTGYMDWPDRGVYFFFASDEHRESGDRLRVTRIGTHAVSEGSSTSLWNRLRTHRGAMRGTYEGGGNHRGSVFRKRVGEAFVERDDRHDEYPHWGEGSSAKRERRLDELQMERRVSDYIRELPFLWLNVDDEPSADSRRAYIERNTIALLSNYLSKGAFMIVLTCSRIKTTGKFTPNFADSALTRPGYSESQDFRNPEFHVFRVTPVLRLVRRLVKRRGGSAVRGVIRCIPQPPTEEPRLVEVSWAVR